MANGVWIVVYPYVFGRSRQLSRYKFFDPSTPSTRKGRNGEWNGGMEKNCENSGPLTSLPVDRLTAADCNSPAKKIGWKKREEKIENNGR